MFKKGFFTLILAVQFVPLLAFQQETQFLKQLDTLTYRQWTLDDGLPVNTVNSIAQDSMGFLWVTTYDGLVRFDGLNFEVYDYSNTPEMPHNRATYLYMQKGVGLWIAMEYGGVMLYRDDTFNYFGPEQGFTSSDITQLYESSDGRMFFETNVGFYVYDDGQFSQYFTGTRKNQKQVNSLFEDTDGSFWLATNNGLVHVKENEDEVVQYHISDRQEENIFNFVHRDSNGILQAGSVDGIYELKNGALISSPKFRYLRGEDVQIIYEDEQVQLYITMSGIYRDGGDSVNKLPGRALATDEYYDEFFRDSDGILWMMSNNGSLSILKNGRHERFDGLDNFDNLYFNSMFEDREQNLWFCTNTTGLISISKSKVRTLGASEGLSGNNILALHEDGKGRFWVGTRGSGLNLIEGSTIKSYTVANSDLLANTIHAIGEDSLGNIWVGLQRNGMNRYASSSFENFSLGDNAESNNVRSIYTDRSGQIWVGTYGGLVMFDPDSEDHLVYGIQDGMSGQKVRYIAEDAEGALWIGTLDGGISQFDNGKFTNYTTEDGLSSNNIRSIYIDKNETGTIWIGTENNGLNRLKDGKIHFVNTEDGLPDHIVHWVSEDDQGWLWMSTNRGVVKIQKAELNQYLDGASNTFTLIHYGRPEGMRSPEGNGSIQEAGLYTRHENFWFATQEGVAIFDPAISKDSSKIPTVLIQGIQAADETFTGSDIEIPKGTHNFEVQFHALTFPAPEKTRFRYRLNGYDEDWQIASNERTAQYANVPADTYTFEVYAANSDGIWTPAPATANITVLPFFYQQAWFYILLLMVVGGGYYAASQIRYRYLIRKQERLQEIIDEQTALIREEKNEIQAQNELIQKQTAELAESNKTKDKFFSIIAHDLRNPFQAILGFSELLYDEADTIEPKDLKKSLGHIHDSSKSLLSLVENLLKWASLNTGKISAKPKNIDLQTIVTETADIFKPVAQQKDIELKVESIEQAPTSADPDMMKTIIRNLLSNAIKFTPKNGEVSLELRTEGEHYLLEVQDTGIGMSQQMIDEVLQIEVNTSRMGTNKEKGSGLGLLICKEMAELHNGTISIRSEEGKGTRFTIFLPREGLPVSA